MRHWFEHEIVGGGRLPLLLFFVGLIVGFLCIRASVRLIRAEVKWWFGNISAGGVHIHHMVFGVVLIIASGMAMIATFPSHCQWLSSTLAVLFGVGSALVLDEFALMFYLRDVYWSEEGRASVDAVFVAVAITGMVLLGFRPFAMTNFVDGVSDIDPWLRNVVLGIGALLNLVLCAVVMLKGKIWTGIIGLFFWPIMIIGAIRLARPTSPWARWRYAGEPRRMDRALHRERTLRRPFVQAMVFFQDLTAGKPHLPKAPQVRQNAERVLDRVVLPASRPSSPPISRSTNASGTIEGLQSASLADRMQRKYQEHEPVER